MKIEHIAIWVRDLEVSRKFYETYFGAKSGEKYYNPKKSFTSYFLSFRNGARLELMHRPEMVRVLQQGQEAIGLTHLAISLGAKEKVDRLTEQLRDDGFTIVGELRTTGDGYYESVVLDPEGNRLEITI
ncbi:MAG: VOC family protein [Bacteroidota bacterium]